MRSSVITLLLVAIIGGLIGFLLQPPASTSNSSTATDSVASQNDTPLANSGTNPDDITTLSNQLAEEIAARKALAQQVDKLTQQLAQLSPRSKPTQMEAAASPQEASPNEAAANTADTNTNWFNEQALIDSGMEVAQAQRLKGFYDKLELDRLYLRDQAIREGWDMNQRREAFEKLDQQEEALQAEIGDDAYDAYLFASGQPNRVAVQSVLSGSAANTSGIQAGDYIVRYDNQRIYSGRDLRQATAQGELGESVGVEIERDGKRLQLFIPRGPMGIRMNSASISP